MLFNQVNKSFVLKGLIFITTGQRPAVMATMIYICLKGRIFNFTPLRCRTVLPFRQQGVVCSFLRRSPTCGYGNIAFQAFT
jgi:hypothetical protein